LRAPFAGFVRPARVTADRRDPSSMAAFDALPGKAGASRALFAAAAASPVAESFRRARMPRVVAIISGSFVFLVAGGTGCDV
jgi:hypothetical protein